MYHRVRRKMKYLTISAILVLSHISLAIPKSIKTTENTPSTEAVDFNIDNNIIDFDEEYSVKFNNKYETVPWHSNDKLNKESHRYTIIKDDNKKLSDIHDKHNETNTKSSIKESTETTTDQYSVIPLELISTTENILVSIIESTTEPDYSVIPLSTTIKDLPNIKIVQTVTLPTSTETSDSTTEDYNLESVETTITPESTSKITTKEVANITNTVETTTVFQSNIKKSTIKATNITELNETKTEHTSVETSNTTVIPLKVTTNTTVIPLEETTNTSVVTLKETTNTTVVPLGKTTNTTVVPLEETTNTTIVPLKETTKEVLNTNSTRKIETITEKDNDSREVDVDIPLFTELDTEGDISVPEDYYDSKDVVPTTAPKTDAISVLVGLAGSMVESVVESVAERVVPKGIFDLFKRMQKQNEALEAERLRSREENGGLGQFGRGILKSISTSLSKPLGQLMAGVRDIGSLDTDRGFVGSLASGVTSVANVANSVVDAFKDRVQAIYPGTVWCGDGHSAQARSSDLGLFFFTDTCCRQHDACKLYIQSGETKYGLTNTGLFTRSHCSCDAKFRECLRRTNSLVSAQIGLTYFNVLGPQCFRRAHPIVKCARRTRITGQKCEEYELDYTKPKMWQWFDNETF